MRCVSYCTASSYDLAGLAASYKRKGYVAKLYRDVLHISSIDTPADIFIFNHGSIVLLGLEKKAGAAVAQAFAKLLFRTLIDY